MQPAEAIARLTQVPDQEPAVLASAEIATAAEVVMPGPLPEPRSMTLGRYVAWLVTADALVAMLGGLLAITYRFQGSAATVGGVAYPVMVPGFMAAWVMAMWLGGAYDKRVLVYGTEEFRRILNGAVWVLATIAIGSFALQATISRTVTAVALVAVTGLSLAQRYVSRHVLHRVLRGAATLHRAVVVGSQEEADSLTSHMQRNAHVGFAVTAIHTPRPVPAMTTEERVEEILEILERTHADTVAIAGTSGFTSPQLRRLAWGLEGKGVRLLMVPALTDLAGPRIRVRPVGGLPLLHIEEPEFTGRRLVLKRAIDFVGAAGLIVLLSPVLLVSALAVLLGSGRPIFYRQIRVGRHGKQFRMFKFRTMVRNADQLDERPADPDGTPVRVKPERDPRVTRTGAFLRRHSMDELPQLFDVIRGDMSLVGPRPHRPVEVAEYGDDVRRRLLIKPGVTGLWQVSGRAALPWQEAVRLDLYYVENWSIWLDMLLVAKTLRAVVLARGAY